MSSTASPADSRSSRKSGPRKVNWRAIRAAPRASVSPACPARRHGRRARAPALVLPARLPVGRDGLPRHEPGPRCREGARLPERTLEQRDEPVVGRHLGHRVPGGQRARGQPRPVAGPGGFIGGRLEVRPGLDRPARRAAGSGRAASPGRCPGDPRRRVRAIAVATRPPRPPRPADGRRPRRPTARPRRRPRR